MAPLNNYHSRCSIGFFNKKTALDIGFTSLTNCYILCSSRLILDYNGTIAVDGQPVQGVKERLIALAQNLEIHVLTADTFGGVKKKLSDIPCKIHVLPVEAQDKGKMAYLDRLDADRTVCIGNGRNDVMMLKKAALGIAVVQDEGAAASAVLSADVVVTDILFALDLITNHMCLTATLRS